MTRQETSAAERAPDRARVFTVLGASRLLRGVDEPFVRALAERSTFARYTRGERVWMRGSPAEQFCLVTRGVLELRRAAPQCDPTLIALFGPGEIPAVPVTLERKRTIADAFATTDALELLRVPAEPILERLPRDLALAGAMQRLLLHHARLLHAKIDVLTAGTVPRRLAVFLLDLAERFGDEREDGSTVIPLDLSRAQIASYVDARVETVIRCFSAWRREGLLVIEPDATVIPSTSALLTAVQSEDP
jgi:CRP-like cAMP-binding protein